MADSDTVRCPLCEGQGELLRSEIAERFTTPNLKRRLDARLAEILETVGAIAHAVPTTRNFEKEVHAWNPQLPMWRRSSKE